MLLLFSPTHSMCLIYHIWECENNQEGENLYPVVAGLEWCDWGDLVLLPNSFKMHKCPRTNPRTRQTEGWVLCSFSCHKQEWDPQKIFMQSCLLCKSHYVEELDQLSASAYQYSILSEHSINESLCSAFCRGNFQEPKSDASKEINKNLSIFFFPIG